MRIEFREIQRFTQWYLWLFLIIIGLMPFYVIFKRINERTFLNDPFKDILILFFSGVIFLLIYLFYQIKLITIIDEKEIRMIFKPFTIKIIKWADIDQAKIVDYGFVGGWGIRYGSKYGVVYNTSGRIGLAIETNKGEKLVIGTKKQQELNNVVQNIIN